MKKSSRNKLIIAAIALVIVGILGFFGIRSYLDRPQDLGPEMEYIGKRHTGCPLPNPFGYLMLCSSESGEEYYFATDLSLEEVKGYFKGAEVLSQRPRLYPSVEQFLEKIDISFRSKTAPEKTFVLYYYLDKEGLSNFANLQRTEKQHIIGISDPDEYKAAKDAY